MLVPKVANTGHQHRKTSRIACRDDVVVFFASPGLNDRGDALGGTSAPG